MAIQRQGDTLHVDGVSLTAIAERFGTPTYVYSWSDIAARFHALDDALAALDHRICYAVKANSNLTILSRLSALGAGFDIVSGGELERVLAAGGDPSKVVFSGVGKSVEDIDFALKAGISCFNVESASELTRLESRAALLHRVAPVSVRLNPDVDAKTHPYISTGLKHNKFGVPESLAIELYRHTHESPHLEVVGMDCHIGSQIGDVEPYADAMDHLLGLADRLAGENIEVSHLDLGGGLGIAYDDEQAIDVGAYGELVTRKIAARNRSNVKPLTFMVEPGRYLVGNSGVLLTRIEYLKPAPGEGFKSFAVVDAAMNDLIRPALYDAYHHVEPVTHSESTPQRWDLVGPVCESGDFLAIDRELAIDEGGLVIIEAVGAYGFVQSSNYNTRARPAEVLIDGGSAHEIRRRESTSDLFRLERIV